jgi:2-isopropylmalate synthase
MPVPARTPYAGELVFTAFSGSHQDAIAKGLAARARQQQPTWEVPYLPIDPADVGRAYEPLIRINSQSGKSGVSFVLEQAAGYRVPKDLAIELSRLVQEVTDNTGKELAGGDIREIFERAYLAPAGRVALVDYEVQHPSPDHCHIRARVRDRGEEVAISGDGKGAIDAFVHALEARLGTKLGVADYSEHALGKGADAEAVAYVKLEAATGARAFGAGRDRDIVTASLGAVVAALNRMNP